MHRDPLRVLPSVARLTEIVRQPFTRSLDRLQIGRQVSCSWARGATILREASALPSPAGVPVMHVHFRQFVKDPLATAVRLYAHFSLPLDEPQRARLASFIAHRRNGGYARNHYRLRDYGLDRCIEERAFRDYREYFSIEPEPQPEG